MQTFQQLFNRLLMNLRVELNNEFDRNFERKAFFDRAWKPAKHNTIGSLMNRTGALRSSIMGTNAGSPVAQIIGTSIRWASDVPYANIQNSGGTITVTPKMRGFFWYRFRVASGGNKKKFNAEALFWKAMALKPVGSTIIIPKRQFIGEHPQVHRSIRETADDWVADDLKKFIDEQLKNMIK